MITDTQMCLWCGRPYCQHRNSPMPANARTLCGGTKAGFQPKGEKHLHPNARVTRRPNSYEGK